MLLVIEWYSTRFPYLVCNYHLSFDISSSYVNICFDIFQIAFCVSNIFALSAATLPQQVSLECVKDMRANVIEKAHETYDWNPKPTSESEIGWGINRYLNVTSKKPLPQLFHTTLGQSGRVLQSGLLSAINAGQALFKGTFNWLDDILCVLRLQAHTTNAHRELTRLVGY